MMYDHYRHRQHRAYRLVMLKGLGLPSEADPNDWELLPDAVSAETAKLIESTGYDLYKIEPLTREEIAALKR